MLAPYRRILAVPGARVFTAAGLLGRLPMSMTGLGIVILVSARTGSYSLAGTLSATEVLAAAVASPFVGRLVDVFGQARVLVPAAVLFLVGGVGFLTAVDQGWPTPVAMGFAVVLGASYPQVGSLVRARWRYLLDDRRQLDTAFALEAVLDEVVFIAGPVLVTFLATGVHPLAGLGTALACGVVGGLWMSRLRATEPPAQAAETVAGARLPIGWRVLAPLVLATVGAGSLFGAAEVVTVAFATEQGDRSDAGWLLALWACGSLLAGLVTGALHLRATALRRLRLGALALAASLVPLLVVGSVPALAVLLFVSGLTIAPFLVAMISFVEQQVPGSRLTEGISWITTGLAVGIAPGAAVSGRVVDVYGAQVGYLVPVVSAAIMALLTWAVRDS